MAVDGSKLCTRTKRAALLHYCQLTAKASPEKNLLKLAFAHAVIQKRKQQRDFLNL